MVKWVSGVAALLATAFILWVANGLGQVDINAVQIDNLESKIERIDHNVEHIRNRVDAIYDKVRD